MDCNKVLAAGVALKHTDSILHISQHSIDTCYTVFFPEMIVSSCLQQTECESALQARRWHLSDPLCYPKVPLITVTCGKTSDNAISRSAHIGECLARFFPLLSRQPSGKVHSEPCMTRCRASCTSCYKQGLASDYCSVQKELNSRRWRRTRNSLGFQIQELT